MSKSVSKRPPSTRKRMILMLVAALVIFGGVFGIKAMIGAQTNKFFDNMPQPAVAVSSANARMQAWSDDAEAVGTFVAVNGADVTTESGGVVRSIEFDAGQPVRAGAVLVRLNSANEEATLRSLEAAAKLAKVQATRWQQLGKDKLVSLDDVQSRVTAAATAQAQVDAQRALIEQKTIRAPFSGVLGIRKVNLGQFVAPGAGDARLAELTAREHEVLLLVAQGLTNLEIAERLTITEATVKAHVGRILTKLDLRDRVQIVVLAYETGLVKPGA